MALSRADKLRYARDAFKEFWSVAAARYPQNMQMSFEEFYGYMLQRGEDSLADFGESVYLTGQGWGQSIDAAWAAMREYAEFTQGRVAQYPDGYPKLSDFYDALLGKMEEWNVERIGAAFGNIAKEGIEKVATVGAVALGGYAAIMVGVSALGLFLILMSYRKK